GPGVDASVGADEQAAAAVAVAHPAEEEAGVLPRHRLEAHLADDQQRDVDVLAPAHAGWGHTGVAAQFVDEFLEPEEGDAEAVLDGLYAEAHSQVRLADAGRPLDQHRRLLADVGTRRQELDLAALDARLKREVEVREGLALRQARQLQRGADAALLAIADLRAK